MLKDTFLYYYDYSLLERGCIEDVGSIQHSGLAVLSDVVVKMRPHRKRKLCFEVRRRVGASQLMVVDSPDHQITHDERRTLILDAECEEDLRKVKLAIVCLA